MEETQRTARNEETHPAIASYMLKLPQTIASLALVFELLTGITNNKRIRAKSMAMALDWSDYFIIHAHRLYSIATSSALNSAHQILKKRVKLKSPFTVRDIYRKNWSGLKDSSQVQEAINILVEHNHLTEEEQLSNNTGGRPTATYRWNEYYSESK